jgi:drug/metabolite transporter (DMT)-like permease
MVAGSLLVVGGVLLFLNDAQDDLGLPLVAAAAVVVLASVVVRAWLRPNRHEG